jgi:hypothetical protein
MTYHSPKSEVQGQRPSGLSSRYHLTDFGLWTIPTSEFGQLLNCGLWTALRTVKVEMEEPQDQKPYGEPRS